MKHMVLLVLVMSAGVLLAQDNNPSNSATPDNSKLANGLTTVRGCVGRFNGDFILVKQDPGMTYELHGSGKVKVGHYLGREVEVTGRTSPSLSTSSDALGRGGAPSSLMITAISIKILSKECPEVPAR
jgi:hypothetical protein